MTAEVGGFLGAAPTLAPHLFTQPFTRVPNARLPAFAGHLGSDACRRKGKESTLVFPKLSGGFA